MNGPDVTVPDPRAHARTRTYRVHSDVGNVIADEAPARHRPKWSPNVASLAYVESGSQLASLDAASKRGVTCPHGDVAKCGVKMWRQVPTEPGGVAQMWRQNVASGSLAGRGVNGRGVITCPRGVRAPWRRQMWLKTWRALPDVASKRGVACPRGVKEPRGVAGRGVRTWRQAPSAYVALQDVASIRGVRKPRFFPARVFKICLHSSGALHRRPP